MTCCHFPGSEGSRTRPTARQEQRLYLMQNVFTLPLSLRPRLKAAHGQTAPLPRVSGFLASAMRLRALGSEELLCAPTQQVGAAGAPAPWAAPFLLPLPHMLLHSRAVYLPSPVVPCTCCLHSDAHATCTLICTLLVRSLAHFSYTRLDTTYTRSSHPTFTYLHSACIHLYTLPGLYLHCALTCILTCLLPLLICTYLLYSTLTCIFLHSPAHSHSPCLRSAHSPAHSSVRCTRGHSPAQTPQGEAEAAVGVEADGDLPRGVQLTLQLYGAAQGTGGRVRHLGE